MVVYGTRPEAIKCAPIIRAFHQAADFDVSVVLTGQHPDMVRPIHEGFGIREEYNLEIFEPGQGLSQIASKTMTRLTDVLEQRQPTAIFVQGDTTSAMASALAAFNAGVPVVHIEAGLRTQTIASPFPEEGNRRLISQIASLHLAATDGNRVNLLRSGVPGDLIVVTGNPVIDALLLASQIPYAIKQPSVAQLVVSGKPLVLVTAHRRESWGAPMQEIAQAIRILALQERETSFVFPLHANPAVQGYFVPVLCDLPNVYLVPPLEYFDMTKLLNHVRVVLTDSGGLQEEAPALGKPVLVLRNDTERPEGIAAGTAELVGYDQARIVYRTTQLLHDPAEYARMARAVNPYGDGLAAMRTVFAVRQWIGDALPSHPTRALVPV